MSVTLNNNSNRTRFKQYNSNIHPEVYNNNVKKTQQRGFWEKSFLLRRSVYNVAGQFLSVVLSPIAPVFVGIFAFVTEVAVPFFRRRTVNVYQAAGTGVLSATSYVSGLLGSLWNKVFN